MNHRITTIAALAVLLTACGPKGTIVTVHNHDGMCNVTVNENIRANDDEDNVYPIPCVITEDTKP